MADNENVHPAFPPTGLPRRLPFCEFPEGATLTAFFWTCMQFFFQSLHQHLWVCLLQALCAFCNILLVELPHYLLWQVEFFSLQRLSCAEIWLTMAATAMLASRLKLLVDLEKISQVIVA